jgi:L-threonylcarbamoyladenylate synthase
MDILTADKRAITQAVSTIQDGGIVAHATETCYGLACDMTNLRAVEKLFNLKKRPHNLPISALFSSLKEAKEYVEWNDKADELAATYLPGPLTLILPLRKDIGQRVFPAPVHAVERPQTLGIRISSNALAQSLAEAYRGPISTTSANLHGQSEPYSAQDVQIQLQADLIIDSGAFPYSQPSTVVDISDGTLRVVRRGNILVQ